MTQQQMIDAQAAVSPYSLGSPRAQELLAAARAMAPALRARRAQARADVRVPDETVAEFRAAGFFKIRGVNLGHQDLEDFMFRFLEIGDFRAEALNEGGNDILRVSIEIKKGVDSAAVSRTLSEQIKQTFELVPQVAVLETGTLAREFEANVKAARFVDRRG